MNTNSLPPELLGPLTLRIVLRQLRVHASIGILPHEVKLRQPLICDADVWVEQSRPQQDRIEEVLDYRLIRETLIRRLTLGHNNLLESIIESTACELCQLPRVIATRLLIQKPNAFDDAHSIGIEVLRLKRDLAANSPPAQ